MSFYVGQVYATVLDYAPKGSALCHGQEMPISGHPMLFSILGTAFGGDGKTTFRLPDLRGYTPVGTTGEDIGQTAGDWQTELTTASMPAHEHDTSVGIGSGPGNLKDGPMAYLAAGPGAGIFSSGPTKPLASMYGLTSGYTGGGKPFSNLQPSTAINYCIAIDGIFPGVGDQEEDQQEETKEADILGFLSPLGTIEFTAVDFTSSGHLPCDGQEYNAARYPNFTQAIKENFGGVPGKTFYTPDLRGRYPLGAGNSVDAGMSFKLGSKTGSNIRTLTIEHIPPHQHPGTLRLGLGRNTEETGNGNALASRTDGTNIYRSGQGSTSTPTEECVVYGTTGMNKPFEVRSPFQVLTIMTVVVGSLPQKS